MKKLDRNDVVSQKFLRVLRQIFFILEYIFSSDLYSLFWRARSILLSFNLFVGISGIKKNLKAFAEVNFAH